MSATTSAPSRSALLGPLTTVFTPPPACSVAVMNCNTCNYGWLAQTCYSSNSVQQNASDEPSCWPSQTSTQHGTLAGYGFYSPGLVCPSGYTTACAAAGTAKTAVPSLAEGTVFPFQYSLLPGETAVGCCPTGYTCLPHWAQTCLSLATSTSFPAVTCDGATSDGFSFWTVPFTYVGTEPSYLVSAATNASITISTVSIYAPLIQINWQASDRPANTTASKTTASMTSSMTSGTPSGSVSLSAHPSSGLSTRDKIAIGVAVPVVVISILLFLLFFFRNKWHPNLNRKPAEAEARPVQTPAEMEGNVTPPPVTQ